MAGISMTSIVCNNGEGGGGRGGGGGGGGGDVLVKSKVFNFYLLALSFQPMAKGRRGNESTSPVKQ